MEDSSLPPPPLIFQGPVPEAFLDLSSFLSLIPKELALLHYHDTCPRLPYAE